MKRQIITTEDGSTTIFLPEWQEHYHSKHGAVQEAMHVFINAGLHQLPTDKPIHILEVGFGTGLNCLLTRIEAKKSGLTIVYTGVEAYPVAPDEVLKMNYCEVLGKEGEPEFFESMHQLPWDLEQILLPDFTLTKRKQFFEDLDDADQFDLVYFDAFGSRVQPELWEEPIFKKMYRALKQGGILVTYSAKGSVRRLLQDLGFEVERLQGPPGKRHMLRAKKL